MKYINTIDDTEYLVEFYSLLANGNSYEANLFPIDDGWQVVLQGRLYAVRIEDERDRQLRLASQNSYNLRGEFLLKAPMPGLIVSLPVYAGQRVEKGEVLAVLESMKMQNELRSPRAGIVSRLRVKIGENVEQKQTLLSVE
jgi:biotin carboxyl carrier protein